MLNFNKDIAPVIFIGPCLSHEETRKILNVRADLRAPVKRGDIESVSPDTQVIGIVDGVFFSQLAVSPREILDALAKNVHIAGSSSMGALRAAELDVYGMKGIGEIYEMYKSGEVESDAEVALTFHPEDYRTLSEPLVNIRYFLKQACQKGIITMEEMKEIVEYAQGIYFFELSYHHLFKGIKGKIEASKIEHLKAYVEDNRNELDLKRKDAIKLLMYINSLYKEE